jgi:hypothetical protein
MKIHLLLVWCLLAAGQAVAQVYSDKVIGKNNEELSDSIKASVYPYVLPIWGEKATKLGFDLPYSAGLNVNYIWQESEITIDNLQVGFNNGLQYALDEIVRFNRAISSTNAINFRPDVWLFPFLNVYGVFAKSNSTTEVDFGVWVPDSTDTWNEVFNAGTKVNLKGTTIGFGLTPTIGIGGGFMAFDMNIAWTDINELEKTGLFFCIWSAVRKVLPVKKRTDHCGLGWRFPG